MSPTVSAVNLTFLLFIDLQYVLFTIFNILRLMEWWYTLSYIIFSASIAQVRAYGAPQTAAGSLL